MIKNFLNPEGYQNPISGSKVMAILLKGWILPIGGVSAGEGLRLQPVQQACLALINTSLGNCEPLHWTPTKSLPNDVCSATFSSLISMGEWKLLKL